MGEAPVRSSFYSSSNVEFYPKLNHYRTPMYTDSAQADRSARTGYMDHIVVLQSSVHVLLGM